MSGAVYEFVTQRYPEQLGVVSFRCVEELSRTFRLDLVLRASGVDVAALGRDLLGQPACLIMRGADDVRRTIHGVVREVEAEGIFGGEDGKHRYRVCVAPRLWMLGQSRNSRIFQDATVREIVDRVLAESRVACRWSLVRALPPRGYCVQHQESDLAFVERLLAEEGIYYAFDQPDAPEDPEVVVFADDARLAPPISGSPELSFRTFSGMAEHDGDVRRFRVKDRVRPGAVLLREYDFQRPLLDLSAAARAGEEGLVDAPDLQVLPVLAEGGSAGLPEPSDTPLLRVYDHHGEFEGAGVDAAVARRHLEQHRARARKAGGESRCRRLVPGQWFELQGATLPEHDGRYLIVRVEHEGHHPEATGGGAAGGAARDIYQNRFSCVPAGVPYRPRLPRRRLQQVTETATVVGPPGQEIHTDALGRVKVQFHWDRQGLRNDHSSCWLRVVHAWAGTGWGFQFIPRIGMEVVVTFAGGDADRPMVTGCVFNAQNPPPFALPRERTKSGIRTRSSRGGAGFNELSFEDRKGWEAIYLHAERDLREHTNRDHFSTVGADKTTQVEANYTTRVGQSQFGLVGANAHRAVGGNAVEVVGGNDSKEVSGSRRRDVAGDAFAKVEGDSRAEVHGRSDVAVGDDATFAAAGDVKVRVGGEARTVVRGGAATSIGGAARYEVRGHQAATFAEGVKVAIGNGQKTLAIQGAPGGHLHVATPGHVDIAAGDGIRLRVGKSCLSITGDEIVLESDTVVLSGGKLELVTDDSSLVMNGDIAAKGKSVKLSSTSDAKLELSSAAKLDGPSIKLGGAAAADKKDREKRDQQAPSTPKTVIHLFDRKGERMTGARYEVSMPGFSKSGTSDDGTVEIPAFEDVEYCHLRWGAAGAASLEYESDVYFRVDVADPREAARRRLTNLGHYCHDVDEMLRAFEARRGEAPGKAFDQVRSAVTDQHDQLTPHRER